MPPAATNVGAGNVVQIAAGHRHNCVLLDTNKVRCWGSNANGELGLGHVNNVGDGPGEMPPPDLNLGGGVITKIGMLHQGGCALFENGELRCWGRNASGELGKGTINNVGDGPGEMPPVVTNYGAGVVNELDGGQWFAQLVMADGSVRNWGEGVCLGYGSVGDFGGSPGQMPPNAVALGGTVIALSKGSSAAHSCVMLQGLTVRCWGSNSFGQLGYGNTTVLGDGPGEMPPAAVQAF
jgi:alpha-tubulin suppressor-like RCC1 family protein